MGLGQGGWPPAHGDRQRREGLCPDYPLGRRRPADRRLCDRADRLPTNRVDGVPAPRVHQHRQGSRRPCRATPRRIGLGDHPAGAHGVHGPRGPGRSRRKDARRPVLPLGIRRHRTHPGRPPHARGRPGRPGTDPDRRRQSQGSRRGHRRARRAPQRRDPPVQSLRPPRVASSWILDRLRSRQPSHAQQAHGDGQRPGDRRRAQHERSLLRGGPSSELPRPRHRGGWSRGPGSVTSLRPILERRLVSTHRGAGRPAVHRGGLSRPRATHTRGDREGRLSASAGRGRCHAQVGALDPRSRLHLGPRARRVRRSRLDERPEPDA